MLVRRSTTSPREPLTTRSAGAPRNCAKGGKLRTQPFDRPCAVMQCTRERCPHRTRGRPRRLTCRVKLYLLGYSPVRTGGQCRCRLGPNRGIAGLQRTSDAETFPNIGRLEKAWDEHRAPFIQHMRPADYRTVAESLWHATDPSAMPSPELVAIMQALSDLLWGEHQASVMTPLFKYFRGRRSRLGCTC
jgi:hypothetical protein